MKTNIPGLLQRFSPACFQNLSALAAAFALVSLSDLPANCAEPDYGSRPPTNAPVGGIGLAYAGELPKFDLQVPETKGDLAGERAAKFGLGWVRAANEGLVQNEPEALAWCGWVALTPVGMAVGGLSGAWSGVSSKKVDTASQAITKAMEDVQVQEAPRRGLLRLIGKLSPVPLTILTNGFPSEKAFPVNDNSLMNQLAPLPYSFAALKAAEERGPLPDEGLEVLLLVRMINHGLSGLDQANAPLSFNMVLHVTVVRVRDHTQLFDFYAKYDSAPKKFVQWAANNAQSFREETERALQSLAAQVVSGSGLDSVPPPSVIEIVQAGRK